MSRGDGDRAAQSRGPSGDDVTAARDAGAPHAVAGVPFAARSRFAGPLSDAPGRPPRNGDATSELVQVADSLVRTFGSTSRRRP